VELVRELGGWGVALSGREERPGIHEPNLRVALHGGGEKLVDAFDGGGGASHGRGAGEHGAEDHGQTRVVGLEPGQDEFEVRGNHSGCGLFLEVVGADEEDDGDRVEGENVVVQPKKNAASGVAADAAVGGLEAWEMAGELVLPALGDGITQEHDGLPVLGDRGGPLAAAVFPELLEPIIAADRTRAKQPVVGGRDLEGPTRGRRGRVLGEHAGGEQQQPEREEPRWRKASWRHRGRQVRRSLAATSEARPWASRQGVRATRPRHGDAGGAPTGWGLWVCRPGKR
jgi:hypothetical protein